MHGHQDFTIGHIVTRLRDETRHKDARKRPAPLSKDNQRCRLLELPAEIREQIWIHTVINWSRPKRGILVKGAIRVDRLNRPLPPAVTVTSRQLRNETLHLYYQQNVFECWRPFVWQHDWSLSTLMYWMGSLGSEKISWLNDVVFLYKDERELDFDVEGAIAEYGIRLKKGIVSYRQELSEYEIQHEGLGLPKSFGRQRSHNHWVYSAS